jgi:heat shock protein HslJ
MLNCLLSVSFALALAGCQSPGSNSSASTDSGAVNQSDSSAGKTDSVLNQSQQPVQDSSTIEGQWFLMAVLSSDTAAGKIPEINFKLADNSFTGNTGCNRMGGKFQKTDSSLIFDKNMMTTKMACPGYNEDGFLKSLLRVNQYRFSGGMLIMMADGVEISKWTRKPEKGPKLQKA